MMSVNLCKNVRGGFMELKSFSTGVRGLVGLRIREGQRPLGKDFCPREATFM